MANTRQRLEIWEMKWAGAGGWKRNRVSGQPCWHEQRAVTILRSSAMCTQENSFCKISPLMQFVSVLLGDIFVSSHQDPLQQILNSYSSTVPISNSPRAHLHDARMETVPLMHIITIYLWYTTDDNVSTVACLDRGNQIKAQARLDFF